MRRRTAVLFGGLALALAACSDSPTPVTPEVIPALAPPASTLASNDPPSVSLWCELATDFCEAFASGGSGGYTFFWTNAVKNYDADGYSSARATCFMERHRVTVTVTDSSGATDSMDMLHYCTEQPF